jgi:hypothetical protein
LNVRLLEFGLLIEAHSFLNQSCLFRHLLGLIKVELGSVVRVTTLAAFACLAIFAIVLKLKFSLLSIQDISEDLRFKFESRIDHAVNGTVSVAIVDIDRVDLTYTMHAILCLDHDTWSPIHFSKNHCRGCC